MTADDESKPMTRTELAMLWDGLGRWLASHPGDLYSDECHSADALRAEIDAELIDRFGG